MKPENKATDTAVPSVDELTGELNREKYHSRYKSCCAAPSIHW